MGIAAEGWRSSAIHRCEADWNGRCVEPHRSLEDRGCLGMVLTNQQRMVRGSMHGQALPPRKSKRDPPR